MVLNIFFSMPQFVFSLFKLLPLLCLVQDFDNEGESLYELGVKWVISVPSVQFFCEPKTALKIIY